MLSIQEIQEIVNAVLKETDKNDEFKKFALDDIDSAIDFIVRRDFSYEMQKRYEQTLYVYRKMNVTQRNQLNSEGLATFLHYQTLSN